VPGFVSWYETSFKNNVHYASAINLQNVASGNVTRIELTSNFPEEMPLKFAEVAGKSKSIREIVQSMKLNSQLE